MISKKAVIYLTVLISMLCEASSFAQRVPRIIKKHFSLCASRDTQTSVGVETAGYYTMNRVTHQKMKNDQTVVSDSFYSNMIFYPDGFFLYNFYGNPDPNPAVVEEYLRGVYDGTGAGIFSREMFYNRPLWGLYEIIDDTIVAQVVYNTGSRISIEPWGAWEYKFVIRSNKTLELLKNEVRSLLNPTKSATMALTEALSVKEFLPAVFVPFAYIPPSDSWLKKQPWIWCENRK